MTGWRIDVSGVSSLSSDVLTDADGAATPITRGEMALADAASALSAVDGVGTAMAGLAESWTGHGGRIASLVASAVGAVTTNVVLYIDSDTTMAATTDADSSATSGGETAMPGHGFSGRWSPR